MRGRLVNDSALRVTQSEKTNSVTGRPFSLLLVVEPMCSLQKAACACAAASPHKGPIIFCCSALIRRLDATLHAARCVTCLSPLLLVLIFGWALVWVVVPYKVGNLLSLGFFVCFFFFLSLSLSVSRPKQALVRKEQQRNGLSPKLKRRREERGGGGRSFEVAMVARRSLAACSRDDTGANQTSAGTIEFLLPTQTCVFELRIW